MFELPVVFLTQSTALAGRWAGALGRLGVPCYDAPAALQAAQPSGSCIVWLDLALAGQAGVRALPRHYQVVAFSSAPDDAEGLDWLGLGAVGYVHAFGEAALLQQVLATVSAGGTWVGVGIMRQLCMRMGQLAGPAVAAPASPDGLARLSEREREVVATLREGRSNKEIARVLGITERTVKAHLTSIFQKFEVEDRLQLLLKLTATP